MSMFFRIVLYAACGAFSILTAIAAGSQLRAGARREAALTMLAGAALLAAAVVCGILSAAFDWLLAVAGSVMIFCSAFYNGKKIGEFHLRHHIIRLALCMAFVVGFILL